MDKLAIISIAMISFTIFMLLVSIFMRNTRFVLMATILTLALANNKYVSELSHLVGLIGGPVFLMGLISVCLIIYFKINIFKIPSYLLGTSGIFLFFSFFVCFVSMFQSENIFNTFKAIVSLFFVIFIGWFLFGNIARRGLNQSRDFIITITDAVGFFCLSQVIFVFLFAGPSVLAGKVGGAESIINICGFSTYRLQAEGFNATGVGVNCVLSIFWLFAILERFNKRPLFNALIYSLITFCFISLIWTGARSAICIFLILWVIRKFVSEKRPTSLSNVKNFLVIIVTFGILSYFFLNDFIGIINRGGLSGEPILLKELFLSGRIDTLGANGYSLFEPTLFGRGYGSLSADSMSGYNIESFYLRLWVELGVVGCIVYILSFGIITLNVFRVDRYFLKLGEPGAIFPSIIFLTTWINSPVGFGFSLPGGWLVIQLGIASVSTFVLNKIKDDYVSK